MVDPAIARVGPRRGGDLAGKVASFLKPPGKKPAAIINIRALGALLKFKNRPPHNSARKEGDI